MMELLLEIKLTVKYIYKCKKKKNQQQSRERCRCTSSLLQYCPFIVLHCPAWSSACTPSPWGFTQETEKFQIQARYTKSTLFFPPLKTDLVFHGQTAGQLATASGSLGSVSLLAALGDRSVCTSLQRALQTLPRSHNALGTPQQH